MSYAVQFVCKAWNRLTRREQFRQILILYAQYILADIRIYLSLIVMKLNRLIDMALCIIMRHFWESLIISRKDNGLDSKGLIGQMPGMSSLCISNVYDVWYFSVSD